MHAINLLLRLVASADCGAITACLRSLRKTINIVQDLPLLGDAHGEGAAAKPHRMNRSYRTGHIRMFQGRGALLHDKSHMPHDFEDSMDNVLTTFFLEVQILNMANNGIACFKQGGTFVANLLEPFLSN